MGGFCLAPQTGVITIRFMTCQVKSAEFFVWHQRGKGEQAAIHDACDAARRKKTLFHSAFWVGIGLRYGEIPEPL